MLQYRPSRSGGTAIDQDGKLIRHNLVLLAEEYKVADIDGIDEDPNELFMSRTPINRSREGHFPGFLAAALEDRGELGFLNMGNLACLGRMRAFAGVGCSAVEIAAV